MAVRQSGWPEAAYAHGVPTDPSERLRELGSFIREQRGTARLSLRRLSEMAGVSNPYLSQIERGLRRPSAEILQQIAKALRISAETLYVQAGILEEERHSDVPRAIFADPQLTAEHKQALIQIYRSFVSSMPAPTNITETSTDDVAATNEGSSESPR